MGREANCRCELNGMSAQVKALLEPPELILRGGLRRRIPFAAMAHLTANGAALRFTFGEEKFSLLLGEAIASKWAKAISAPPPSLAEKLGIAPESTVRILGTIDDEALHQALAAARTVTGGDAALILARVNTQAELDRAFGNTANLLSAGAPIWIIYRKGPGHAIGESDVRSAGLAVGVVDVKVTAVSTQLTALKFVKRKNPSAK
jgi:hypothetical protein